VVGATITLFIASSVFGAAEERAFVGSANCRECHQRFYELWAPSRHGLAMRNYSLARRVLTEQTAEIRVGTNTYRADLDQGVVVERGGPAERRLRIEQALGGKNVFYFLTPLERGRLQVLPIAYDVRRKEWFDTAASAVRHFGAEPDEPLHWTEPAYTFNTSCFNCHVSQLTNHYDPKNDTYHTAWAEPGINCEACHGGASAHVNAARDAAAKGAVLKDVRIINFKDFDADQVNALCSSCHAKLYPVANSFAPGNQFHDHFGLHTLEDVDFYPDGRDLGENFTMTSWRLGACGRSGKIHCVNCHTSSGRYRFAGTSANQACLPCHEHFVKDAGAHSHHAADGPGAECVACHMPMTEFARMRRTDHSMRPPMPASTLAFGSPNACNLCHTNNDAAWADGLVRAWYTNDYQAATLRLGSLIAAARKGDWSRLPEITRYLAGHDREEIWAASFLHLLRGCDDESKWAGIVPCLKDPHRWCALPQWRRWAIG
jgi:hypothetical protein